MRPSILRPVRAPGRFTQTAVRRQFSVGQLWRNAKQSIDGNIKKNIDNAVREQAGEPKKKQSLKDLMKKYGWTAAGVYLGLSAIDLPIAFVIVHSMGQERVQEIERAVKGFFGFSTKTDDLATSTDGSEGSPADQDSNGGWSPLLTEFALAYAIHKSVFVFVRFPLTAAITPWAARTLRKWGFNVGNTASTPKFGTKPTKRQRWTDLFF